MWDIAYDDEMDHVQGHKGQVTSLHYNAEFPSKLMSGGAYPDDTIKIWDRYLTLSCQPRAGLSVYPAHSCIPVSPPYVSKGFLKCLVSDSTDLHCERSMLGGGQNFAINGLCAMRYGIGASEVCRLYRWVLPMCLKLSFAFCP